MRSWSLACALIGVGAWWNPEHTYSGQARGSPTG
jgi:hypothetical protein